jgi:hypothetical protein
VIERCGGAMFRLFKHSQRKYPIEKDEYGWSLRKRCFALFDKGERPAQVTKELNVNFKTVCRYFQDWKKIPKNYNPEYKAWHRKMKNDSEFSEKVIKQLAEFLEATEGEIAARLQKPWALAQLLKGEWELQGEKEVQSGAENRLKAALAFLQIFELCGQSPEWIKTEIEQLQNKARRLYNQQIQSS